MAINKDNVLEVTWNNESLLQIRTALQELLTALGDSIDAAAGGNPASINLSVEGTVLTASVTLADGETELSSSVDLAGAISAAQVAVEIVNNLYTDSSSKALSAAMGVQLDRMSGTVLKHLHWVPGAAHALLAVGNHARYFEPEQGKIYHFYGYTPSGQGQPELGLDVYTPPAGIIFYDIETGSCYRFDGMDMVDILSSKANTADVYTKSEVNTMVGGKQDTLTFDDEPTAGHTTQVMSSDKIKTAIDQVTPTIDANGKWVIGGVATDKDAQGPRGNTVLVNENAQGIQALIVNNISDGGETDILSAEMGKVLRQNIMRIFNALGTYAFPEGKPTLNWGSTVINHSINVNGVTGGLTIADVEIDGVSAASLPAQIVEGKSLSLRLVLPSDLYVFNDGVSITMGGVNITTQQGVWDESTGEINIAVVTGDIVISANAITYVGYGEQNSPLVLMLDGKNQGSTANQWENLCDTNKPLVLSGGYTKSSDHVAFDGIDGNGVIDQLNINMPYKTTSVETVFSFASMPPASNSIMIINNFAGNTIMAFGTGSGIYANSLALYACTKYYQEETESGYTSPLLDAGAGNYMFSANQVVRLCRYGQQFSLNNNTLVNTNGGEGLRINVGKDSGVLGDFSVSGFINRQGTYFGPFNGSLYCVRVYSRILTDNEKAQNYKVDHKRFNIS